MSSPILIQDVANSITFYLETKGGSPATDLTTSSIKVDLKKSSQVGFFNKPLEQTTNATATIGSGANGVVTVSVPGTLGNSYSIEVVVPTGTSDLNVELSGKTITVNLAVSSDTPVTAENTAALIASAIDDAVADALAEASGDGSSSISVAENLQSLSGGTDGDFAEIGDGFYSLNLSADNLDTAGVLYIKITGTNVKTNLQSVLVASSISPTPPTVDTPNTTTVFGTILKADGSAAVNASVQATILSIPAIVDGIAITVETVSTKTDSYGQFTLELITGSQVDIVIPSVNYRRTITVPSSSTDLFSIA